MGLLMTFAAISFLTPIVAQDSPETVKGTIDLVLKASIAVTHGKGPIDTGHPSFDSLLTRFRVDSLVPIFGVPPKPEHVAVFYHLNMDKYWAIYFAETTNTDSVLEAFAGDALVEAAEPISYGVPCLTPADGGFARQWYHNQLNGVDINSPQGWDYDTASADVMVAVLDQGIDSLHRELSRNLWKNVAEVNGLPYVDDDGNGKVDDKYGWDFGQNDTMPVPDYYAYPPCSQADLDALNHGVRVAGVLMAQTSYPWDTDNRDMVGVMWRSSVLNVKVTAAGRTDENRYSQAIQYAAQTGAQVISMSYAFYRPGPLATAVQYADQLGSVQVAAIPNPSQLGMYPWSYPQVIAVSKIDASGLNVPHLYYVLDTTSVVAPGVNIYTSDAYVPGKPDTLCDDYIGAEYSYLTGNSLATPMVAGVAAMAIAHRSHLLGGLGTMTPAQVRQLVWNATDDYGVPGFDNLYGRGKVNMQKTMLAVGRGDINNDHAIDISDPVYLVAYINGGPAPQPQVAVADCNCDGTVDISDAVYLISYLFSGGAPPSVCFYGL